MDHMRAGAAVPLGERDRLAAAEKAFPDWDFHPVLGGWLAVPAGTELIRGMFLDSLVEKLRKREEDKGERES